MSCNNKKNRIEERVYSITMTEEELKLFSEFLKQANFSRGYKTKLPEGGYFYKPKSSGRKNSNNWPRLGQGCTPTFEHERIIIENGLTSLNVDSSKWSDDALIRAKLISMGR